METAFNPIAARIAEGDVAAPRGEQERRVDESCESKQDQAGMATGLNLEPGSDDDGWTVPSPVTLADGTQVQLYKDGEALHAAYEAIRSAKQRICLESYIFADDQTGHAFAELLAAKARKGVGVHVVYDSFGSLGPLGKPKPMFDVMRRAGVKLQEFHPMRPWECRFSWRPVNRDHRKLLVIDHDRAGLGGINVGAEYAGSWVVQSERRDCDLWRDNAVGIRGPGARLLLRAFAKTWHYVNNGGRISSAELHHPVHDSEDSLGILASVPTLNSPLRPLLHQLLRGARKSIQLTMAYFAPDDPLIAQLCRAARRGVRVQLMLPAVGDVKLLILAARSFYEVLLAAGVEVYERQSVVLHAKTIVVDEELSVVGSTNLDYRSIEYNLEIGATIRSRAFGAQMAAMFANDVKFARRITAKEWRRRPWVDRAVQWGVSRARYLL
ncbi:MAG: phospholipase D-like domain-containing protein [Tepidisphaeraceae bacterium]